MTSAGRKLRILFLCGSDLRSPSEKQVLWLSSYLAERGHRVMIGLRGDPGSAESEGAEGVDGVELLWYAFRGPRLTGPDRAAAVSFRPDLIHAWYPRVQVIAAARDCSRATGAPVLVHWEDDEWGIMHGIGPPSSAVKVVGRLGKRLGARLRPSLWHQATDASIAWATANGAAFDALTPILAEYVRSRTGREVAVVLPTLPAPAPDAAPPPQLPSTMTGRPLIALTGALIGNRLDDFRLALQGAAAARRRGADLGFVLAGRNLTAHAPEDLAAEAGLSKGEFVYLDHVPYPSIPALLERSSVLLAVSHPTSLNVMCLPSKLQSYLISGTPTIVSAHGAGEMLRDKEEVLKLREPDPEILGELIAAALSNADLRRTLSGGGVTAAQRLFDPDRNTDAMLDHYRASLTR